MSTNRWTTPIAIASVAVAVLTAASNYFILNMQIQDSRQTAKEQLNELRSQLKIMTADGPQITVTGDLALYHPDTRRWDTVKSNKDVSSQEVESGNLVLRLHLTNEGRFQSTISDVGIGTNENSYQPADKPNCDNASAVTTCKLPLILKAQTSILIYVDLEEPAIRKALTCNSYDKNGLQYVVSTIGSPTIVQRLPNTVYYVTDACR